MDILLHPHGLEDVPDRVLSSPRDQGVGESGADPPLNGQELSSEDGTGGNLHLHPPE